MSENGSETQEKVPKTNIWREMAGQVADHIDLASLELRYETQQLGKKVVSTALIFILALTGFIILQVAIIDLLVKAGLPLAASAGLLGGVYIVLALVVFQTLGRRDKRAGPPFAGTQRELHETMQWIQKILS